MLGLVFTKVPDNLHFIRLNRSRIIHEAPQRIKKLNVDWNLPAYLSLFEYLSIVVGEPAYSLRKLTTSQYNELRTLRDLDIETAILLIQRVSRV